MPAGLGTRRMRSDGRAGSIGKRGRAARLARAAKKTTPRGTVGTCDAYYRNSPLSAGMGICSTLPVPPVLWAQRKNVVYVKVALEDCKNPTINLTADSLHFKGTGGVDAKPHEVTLRFLHSIKPEESKYVVRPRGTEFVLAKAEEGPFWKRLLQGDAKHHWLKVDFNKWVDEDDSGDELGAGGGDFEEMMRSMGGLGDDDTPDLVRGALFVSSVCLGVGCHLVTSLRATQVLA
ncbi:hypothetical protein HPB48_015114 [Haemaphysalis longicornis]|uniref:CS domain-containing protein n=1 Tax=Haemaphysalis longicornis TaxID=44386 RepID=A0A9J6G4W0_HAELO|nr:hypothetical protein HPB48_015114 [Haemaphysalis longicornis]